MKAAVTGKKCNCRSENKQTRCLFLPSAVRRLRMAPKSGTAAANVNQNRSDSQQENLDIKRSTPLSIHLSSDQQARRRSSSPEADLTMSSPAHPPAAAAVTAAVKSEDSCCRKYDKFAASALTSTGKCCLFLNLVCSVHLSSL